MTGGTEGSRNADTRRTDTSLLDLVTPLLRRWRLMLGFPLLAGGVAAILSLTLPARYTATTSFLLEASGQVSDLAGLAGQFGVNLPSTGASPDFFAAVVRSREVLLTVLRSNYSTGPDSARERTLEAILDIRGETEAARTNAGLRKMQKVVTSRVGRLTGIVTVSVELATPDLAADVANHVVETVNRFNLERRQSQSRERRRFIGERLEDAGRELQDAEAAHLTFLERNRSFRDSPQLAFEEDRLSRQVALRQEVFVTLSREYEEARIAEVRDTPLLTIVDRAVPPDRRSFPQRKLMVFLAVVAAAFTALMIVYAEEYRSAVAIHEPGAYQGFLEALATIRAEVRTMLGRRPRRL